MSPGRSITLHDASIPRQMDAAAQKVNDRNYRGGRMVDDTEVRMPDEDQQTDAPHLTGQQARGGDIVLRTPARRAVFVGGLVLIVIVAVIGYWLS